MYNTATHMLVGPQINCHLFGTDLKKKNWQIITNFINIKNTLVHQMYKRETANTN